MFLYQRITLLLFIISLKCILSVPVDKKRESYLPAGSLLDNQENSTAQFSIANIDEDIVKERCHNDSLEIVSPIVGKPRCCKKCPLGSAMLQLCTNDTDTVCRPCKEGSEYSSISSATSKCLQCTRCQDLHPFAKTKRFCSSTSDTACECVAGYYFSEKSSSCIQCTKCPVGYGAEKQCSWNADSVCKPCTEHTWSSTSSATESCHACTKCKQNELEIRPCSPKRNSFCCPLDNLNCEEIFEIVTEKKQPDVRLNKSFEPVGEDYPMITIFCSLLGLIILFLLAYVIYKVWQQRLVSNESKIVTVKPEDQSPAFNRPQAFSDIKKSTTACNTEAVEKHPKGVQNTIEEKDKLLAYASPHENEITKSAHQKYANIPTRVLTKIAEQIAVDYKWKTVGRHLNYTVENLNKFEMFNNACMGKGIDTSIEHSTNNQNEAALQILRSWLGEHSSEEYNLLQVALNKVGVYEFDSFCNAFSTPQSAFKTSNGIGNT